MSILKKTVLTSIILVIVTSLVFYIWIRQHWKSVRSQERMDNFISQVESSPGLPNRFYKLYSLAYEYDENTSTFWSLVKYPWKVFFNNGRNTTCPCMEANYGFVVKMFDRWSVALEVEDKVGPQKCLDAYLNSISFQEAGRSIHNASEFFFKKKPDDLSDDEMLALVAMSISPSRYSIIRNPEALKEKVAELKQLL